MHENILTQVMGELDETLKRPVFEAWDGDKHYRIWSNGQTEGFSGECGIFNLFSLVLHHAIRRTAQLAGNTVGSPEVNSAFAGNGLSQTLLEGDAISAAKCEAATGEKKNEA